MDKKEKFLNKIPVHDKIKILEAIDCILVGDVGLLNVVKIKDSDNKYRVRVGNYRIKFIKHVGFNEVTEVGYRNDNTY